VNLSHKTDAQVLEGMTVWVGKEREAASGVLHHLREIEERKLYLPYASSPFDFCIRVHKYSRHEAQTRIDAMRLMKSVPEIDADIDAGRLSLTVAAQTQSAFRKEDERRAAAGEEPLSEEEQKTVLADLMSASTREADRKLATHFPDQPQSERTKPVSSDITRIAFNARSEFMKKLERLQAVYFHQTGGKWEKLFELLADKEIANLDAPPRQARGMKRKSTAGTAEAQQVYTYDEDQVAQDADHVTAQARPSEEPQQNQSRYVPKQVHQEVWADWDRGCVYILENGERCCSKQNLQRDHIIEFAFGGSNEKENLRLLCGAHNRYRSDRAEQIRREIMNRIERERLEVFEELKAEGYELVSLSELAESETGLPF
jgi:5-methylcytosine-specific restriction endonuclease McrA